MQNEEYKALLLKEWEKFLKPKSDVTPEEEKELHELLQKEDDSDVS